MLCNFQNEKGFTLVEALLSLFVTTAIIFFLSTGLIQSRVIKKELVTDSTSINQNADTVSGERQIEWHLFLNQLEFYLENSRNPQAQSDLFLVEEWDEAVGEYNLVRYRRPSTNLRVLIRSKRGGNQYMLMGANRIRFELAENGWLIVTNSFDGVKEFEGRIWVKSWIEEHLE